MPTIIDSLLVKLGLDSSEFDTKRAKVDKGLKDTGGEADKTGSKLKKSGKDGAEGFETVAKSAAKFLAIIGGTMAVKRFIENQIEANAALDRFAKNLDQSVNSISAWSNAAELAGGSAEGLQGTMDMLSKSQTELQLTGQSSLIPYLSALSISLADTQGKARPVSDLLLDLSDRFSKMDRTTANNMGRTMGIDQGTMQLLLKGRSEVELMIARQKEYGAVTKKQAEEASRLRNAMVAGRQSFEAFGRELVSAVTPALEKMLELFSDFGAWARENKEFVQTFLTILAVGLAGVAAAIIPINLTAVAVVALAAAIAALWQDYQTWKRGGDSFIDWAKWEPGIKAAGEGLKVLKNLLVDILIRAVAAADALLSLAKGDLSGAKTAAKAFLLGVPGQGLQSPASPAAPASTDRAKFIATASARLGVPESVVDAHLRSETGASGKSTIGSFNYGNIKTGKGWHGDSKSKNVLEYDAQGRPLTQNSAFRSYGTPEDAGADYAALIARRFPGAVGAGNAAAYAGALKAGGYATDPNYVSKISAIARGIPGASMAAAGAGAGQVAQASSGALGGGARSVETHVGEIKVYTQATDAAGIAKDIGKEINYLFTSQANYGLS